MSKENVPVRIVDRRNRPWRPRYWGTLQSVGLGLRRICWNLLVNFLENDCEACAKFKFYIHLLLRTCNCFLVDTYVENRARNDYFQFLKLI
jgi:hypothetical protein